jgi:hypothetical protein
VASATYAWAEELRGSGVRVNAVSPQARTRMSDITADFLSSHGLPLYPGTQPEPEANAPAVVYLLSDAASGVTGQIVRIEGRQLALMTHPCVLLPFPTREEWTAETVAEAFAADLAARQQPVGSKAWPARSGASRRCSGRPTSPAEGRRSWRGSRRRPVERVI